MNLNPEEFFTLAMKWRTETNLTEILVVAAACAAGVTGIRTAEGIRKTGFSKRRWSTAALRCEGGGWLRSVTKQTGAIRYNIWFATPKAYELLEIETGTHKKSCTQ